MSIQPDVPDPIMLLPQVQAATDGQKSELILPSKIQELADNNIPTQSNGESHNRDWKKNACKAESSPKNTLIKVLFTSAVLLGVGLIAFGIGSILFSPTLHDTDAIRMEKRLGSESPRIKQDVNELLQLQRNLKDTHYVFSHGMSKTQAKITGLISDLDHRLWPNRDAKEFIFSRVVPPYKIGTPLKEIFLKLYKQNDHDLRDELLCVDADLLNSQISESALHFYSNNWNVFRNLPWIICDVFKKFSEEFRMEFSEEGCMYQIKILEKIKPMNDIGNILVYAVPKKLVHDPDTNFIYTSKAYGEPISRKNALCLLDELVKGPERDTGISVRLLTSHLKPENGIKSFLIGDMRDEGMMDKMQTIKLRFIADFFYRRIVDHCHTCKLPNPLAELSEPLNAQCERLVEELSHARLS